MHKKLLLFICFIFCTVVLFACQGSQQPSPSTSSPNENEEPEPDLPIVDEKTIIPTPFNQDQFIDNIGWINEEEVILTERNGKNTDIVQYNLFDGSKKILFTTNEPYVDVNISPDQTKVLLHTAPLTYSATIRIFDLSGKFSYEEQIPSYELSYEWNSFDPNQILITSFAEDWSFTTSVLNINENALHSLDVSEPFMQWYSDNEFIYQNWNMDTVSLTAPLIVLNHLTGHIEQLEESVLHYKKYPESLLTITPIDEEQQTFQYKFQENNVELSSFAVNLLSRYSDWYIPYYDMLDENDAFFTFVTKGTGFIDTYSGSFTLEKWDPETGEKLVLFDELMNEPISCSSDGQYCLYGHRFEKVISLGDKEIIQLLK